MTICLLVTVCCLVILPLAAAQPFPRWANGLRRVTLSQSKTLPRIRTPSTVPRVGVKSAVKQIAQAVVKQSPVKTIPTSPKWNLNGFLLEQRIRQAKEFLDRDPEHRITSETIKNVVSAILKYPEFAQLVVGPFGPSIPASVKKFEQDFVRGSHKELSELEKDFPASKENSQTGGITAVWFENNPKVPLESAVKNIGSEEKIILYFHGGAFIVGSATTHQGIISKLAIDTEAKVLGINYRLAPQHPYPAALYDVLDVYLTLIKSGVDASRIVFAGDSAGGNLAVAATLWLRDNYLPMPSGVAAMSPWLDLGNHLPSFIGNGRFDFLPDPRLLKEWDPNAFNPFKAYISNLSKNKIRLPVYASPIWARPHPTRRLPPMVFFVGDAERLLDSSLFFQSIFPESVSVKMFEYAAHVDPMIARFHDFSAYQLEDFGNSMKAIMTGSPSQKGITWVKRSKEEFYLGKNALSSVWQARSLLLAKGQWTDLQDSTFFQLLFHHINSFPVQIQKKIIIKGTKQMVK